MKAIPYEIGRVVISKQGHDKGDWLVVVGLVDDRHVLVADGIRRKLDKPKKKQTKHLRAKPILVESIAEAMTGKKPLLDSDIRKAVMQAKDTTKQVGQGSEKQKEECALVQE